MRPVGFLRLQDLPDFLQKSILDDINKTLRDMQNFRDGVASKRA